MSSELDAQVTRIRGLLDRLVAGRDLYEDEREVVLETSQEAL